MSNSQVIYKENFDCKTLTINAILSRIIPKSEFIWNQAGLAIYENENNLIFTPHYTNGYEHLYNTANIRSIEYKLPNFELFLEKIIFILNSGSSTLVRVDIFDLPFNMYYCKHKGPHYIEITHMEHDQFFVCDHFYKYSGFVDIAIIVKAMQTRMDIEGNNEYIFHSFDTDGHSFKLDRNYLFKVMTKNNSQISGEGTVNFLDIPNHKRLVGLKTFDRFDNYLEKHFHQKGPLKDIYKSLFNLSNSRYHYSKIISQYKNNYNNLEVIEDLYLDSYQNFRIAANLVLKLRASKKERAYLSNLKDILSLTLNIEREASKLVEDFTLKEDVSKKFYK
ncbi:hypothetical protein [Lysinibacillus sphaericus]|uniref:hypothetical protein n=1 Tax=Lysinibacillus sphaericus TaxID=1421 RepID=UPI00190FEDDF|nr:hypothetical protein [Lysinibacillus sphaericus]QPA52735.1 hypothetical protein INQ53_12495 [Lysinibacillus sphaericus]